MFLRRDRRLGRCYVCIDPEAPADWFEPRRFRSARDSLLVGRTSLSPAASGSRHWMWASGRNGYAERRTVTSRHVRPRWQRSPSRGEGANQRKRFGCGAGMTGADGCGDNSTDSSSCRIRRRILAAVLASGGLLGWWRRAEEDRLSFRRNSHTSFFGRSSSQLNWRRALRLQSRATKKEPP
jgi:hypothetical protein